MSVVIDAAELEKQNEMEIDTNGLVENGTLKRKREEGLAVTNGVVKFENILTPQLVYETLKTGICYDVRMRYHCQVVTTAYDYVDPHPEDPRRIYQVYKAIADAGLINDPHLQGRDDLGPLMEKIPIRDAQDDEILMVHSSELLNFIKSTATMSRDQLIKETLQGDSIYLSNDSYKCALLSCGGTIEVCKAIVERKVKNGIAVVRPPGHHAEPETPGGFCLFSNVAVAAQVLLKNYPESVRRILILDWDVHHGNGTQKAFLNDPRVLYISLHRYEDGKFYPSTKLGAHTVVGEGEGKGYNVNIPWSKPGKGDGDYIYAFEKVVMPIAFEFDPDFVILSAGFDAAIGDPMGGCKVSPNGYAHMTHMLKSLANGHLAVILEGGYNLMSIANSALAVTKVLLGDPPGNLLTKLANPLTIRDVSEVMKVHSAYWKCLKPEYAAIDHSQPLDHHLFDNIIRTYQATQLAVNNLISLPILKNSLQQMSNQILASSDIHNRETIVVIVHDSPEIWAATDPILGTIDPGKSILVDGAEKFIKWSISKGFGIVDITVPAESDDDDSYSAIGCAQETCIYVYDNYLEYCDAKNIVYIGIGHSYSGLVYLAEQRDLRERTGALISFIGTVSLRPVNPIIDEYTTDWFYRSSLIFTAENHVCWDLQVNPKRPRRKYGRVLKSNSYGISETVKERFEESIEFIEEALEDEEEPQE